MLLKERHLIWPITLTRGYCPCFVIITVEDAPFILLTFTAALGDPLGELLLELGAGPFDCSPIFFIVDWLVSTAIVGGAPGTEDGMNSADGETFTGTTKKG
jgi:hypothetical protein